MGYPMQAGGRDPDHGSVADFADDGIGGRRRAGEPNFVVGELQFRGYCGGELTIERMNDKSRVARAHARENGRILFFVANDVRHGRQTARNGVSRGRNGFTERKRSEGIHREKEGRPWPESGRVGNPRS